MIQGIRSVVLIAALCGAAGVATAQEAKRQPAEPARPPVAAPPAAPVPAGLNPLDAVVVTELSEIPEGDRMVTLVYQPRFARVGDLVGICQLKLREARSVQMVGSTNSLIVTESANVVRGLARVIEAADRFSSGVAGPAGRRFLEVTAVELTKPDPGAPFMVGSHDPAQLVGEPAAALMKRLVQAALDGSKEVTVVTDVVAQIEENREVQFQAGDMRPTATTTQTQTTTTTYQGYNNAGIELRLKWGRAERGNQLEYQFERSRFGEGSSSASVPPDRTRQSLSGCLSLEEGKGVILAAYAAPPAKDSYLVLFFRLSAP